MRFIDFLRTMNGQVVDMYVHGLSDIPREDGARFSLQGRIWVGEDFVMVQNADNQHPAGVKVDDIICVEPALPECTCGECPTGEPDETEDAEARLNKILWHWEREQGNLES